MTKKNYSSDTFSAANLPEEYTIKDPRSFITNFRKTYLVSVRKRQGYSVKEISTITGADIAEILRIENGIVTEQDIMLLNKLAEVYKIDFHNLLYTFKLVKRQSQENSLKMAACHNQQINEETQEMLTKLLERLRDI